MSRNLLKKAELHCKDNKRLLATTFNNLACFYSRTQKTRTSITYLEEALILEYSYLNSVESEKDFEECLLIDNPSDAHLNICVSLSSLGRHEQALQHAMKALVFVQSELIQRQNLIQNQHHDQNMAKILQNERLKPIEDRYVVLAIAYHNIASEQEYLKIVNYQNIFFLFYFQYDSAYASYMKASTVAKKFLGPDHMMTSNLEQVLKNVKQKMESLSKKNEERTSKAKFNRNANANKPANPDTSAISGTTTPQIGNESGNIRY